MQTTTIIKQTVVRGSGRNTKYSNVPTWQEARALRALGYSAALVNIAPRGGVWGETIQVPTRQAEKAKRALTGETVYASRSVERAAKAKAKAQQIAAREVEENVISKDDVQLYCDVGSVKIEAEQFTPISTHVWTREGAHMVPNGYGDGDMRLTIVKVRDSARCFSRHEAFGDAPPTLMAEASGLLTIYYYDCGKDRFRIQADAPVRIYSKNRRVYIVGTNFNCSILPGNYDSDENVAPVFTGDPALDVPAEDRIKVIHHTFGEGEILQEFKDKGQAVVYFQNFGRKLLSLEFAKLIFPGAAS